MQRKLGNGLRSKIIVKKVRVLNPNTKLAYSTLVTAKGDLKGSIISLNGGDYPGSIARLQQCVEKGCKSFGYQVGLIEERNVGKEISHYGSRVFIKIIDYIQSNYNHIEKRFKQLGKIYPELKDKDQYNAALKYFSEMERHNKQLRDDLENRSSNSEKYRAMSFEEINRYIEQCERFDREIEVEEAKLDEYLSKLLEEYEGQELQNKIPEIGVDKLDERATQATETIIDMVESIDEEFYLNLMTCFRYIVPLLTLSIITQPHYQSSRYPIDNVPPEEIYTADYPIVKLAPKIQEICRRAIDNLEESYKEMNASSQKSTPPNDSLK